MKLVNPFNPEFWFEHEPPRCQIVHLNTPFARANAQQAAEALERDRADYEASREQRLVQLLRLSMRHVKDSCQGRGDPGLEKLIMEELARG
jgi:hypothetical protein